MCIVCLMSSSERLLLTLFPFSRNVYISPCAAAVSHFGNRPFVLLSTVSSKKTDNPLQKIFWKETVAT